MLSATIHSLLCIQFTTTTEDSMKIRTTLAAASAAAVIATGTPAIANAQIVAPEPSSRITIPGDVVSFFDGFSPVSRYETEQALKIGTAYLLISTGLSVAYALLGTTASLGSAALSLPVALGSS